MDQSRKIYLHVGSGRTGRSFMQTVLAANSRRLEARGLVYRDINRRLFEREEVTDVKKGNGNFWLDVVKLTDPAQIDELLDRNGVAPGAVFSAEAIVGSWHAKRLEPLFERLQHRRIDSVVVLALTRNPLDAAISMYAQRMKMKPDELSIDEYLLTKFNAPIVVLRTIEKLLKMKPAPELHVHSYPLVKDNLTSVLEGWLGLPAGFLDVPDFLRGHAGATNRTLSRAELAVLRMMEANGIPALRFSRQLITQLPEKQRDTPMPSPEAVEAFCEKMKPVLRGTELLLDRDDLYQPEDALVAKIAAARRDQIYKDDEFVLSEQQLKALVSAVVAVR